MPKFTYKKIKKSDEKQLRQLISNVLSSTPPDFFIPYEQWEMDSLYDESYSLLHGAYIDDKLIGTAQLYIQQEMLKDYKEELGLTEEDVCELGGNLVLEKHRGHAIQYKLMKLQYDLAKNMAFKYIITMSHPKNIASVKNIEKLGLRFIKEKRLSNGFLRNLYCSEI